MAHQTKYLHVNNEKLMIWKTKFTSLKQYLFGLVFSSSTKRTRTYQSILQVFNPVFKEMFHKSSKAAATKNFYPSMYMLLVKLASINVFHPITGKHYFLYKFIVSSGSLLPRNVAAFFEISVLNEFRISSSFTAWKVSVFGIIQVRVFLHLDWIRRDSL